MIFKLKRAWSYIQHDVPQGFKNLFRWFPIIWQDRDWDHYFIYSVLRKKLKQMEDFQRDHGIAVSHKKISKQIRICRCLLDRLMKDDYMENALFWHEKKFGDRELGFRDTDYGDPGEWQEMYTYYPKLLDWTPEKIKMTADKDWHRCYEHSEKMQQQDLDMLFSKMNKQVRGWWD